MRALTSSQDAAQRARDAQVSVECQFADSAILGTNGSYDWKARTFSLPSTVDADSMMAACPLGNGLLVVYIPTVTQRNYFWVNYTSNPKTFDFSSTPERVTNIDGQNRSVDARVGQKFNLMQWGDGNAYLWLGLSNRRLSAIQFTASGWNSPTVHHYDYFQMRSASVGLLRALQHGSNLVVVNYCNYGNGASNILDIYYETSGADISLSIGSNNRWQLVGAGIDNNVLNCFVRSISRSGVNYEGDTRLGVFQVQLPGLTQINPGVSPEAAVKMLFDGGAQKNASFDSQSLVNAAVGEWPGGYGAWLRLRRGKNAVWTAPITRPGLYVSGLSYKPDWPHDTGKDDSDNHYDQTSNSLAGSPHPELFTYGNEPWILMPGFVAYGERRSSSLWNGVAVPEKYSYHQQIAEFQQIDTLRGLIVCEFPGQLEVKRRDKVEVRRTSGRDGVNASQNLHGVVESVHQTPESTIVQIADAVRILSTTRTPIDLDWNVPSTKKLDVLAQLISLASVKFRRKSLSNSEIIGRGFPFPAGFGFNEAIDIFRAFYDLEFYWLPDSVANQVLLLGALPGGNAWRYEEGFRDFWQWQWPTETNARSAIEVLGKWSLLVLGTDPADAYEIQSAWGLDAIGADEDRPRPWIGPQQGLNLGSSLAGGRFPISSYMDNSTRIDDMIAALKRSAQLIQNTLTFQANVNLGLELYDKIAVYRPGKSLNGRAVAIDEIWNRGRLTQNVTVGIS